METIIVGAGIAGLLLAEKLSESGINCLILEKSRGVGGRMATKRIDDFSFDQGAPFFTARDPLFIDKVKCWQKQGVVENWNFSKSECWRGRLTMNAVAKYLSHGKKIQRECKVVAISQIPTGWELNTESGELFLCHRLLMTLPVPQSLALLNAGGICLNKKVLNSLEDIQYESCLAGCFLLKGASEIPESGVVEKDDFFSWISDRTAREGKDRLHSTIVVHAPGDWSSTHYSSPEAEILAIFEGRLKPWIGSGVILEQKLHRWKFAKVIEPYPAPFYLNPEGTFGMAGDGFGGARVEGAALSGIALAQAILNIRANR